MFRTGLLQAYRCALSQALPPKPRVARHWESTQALTWLGMLPDQGGFHLAFSFGRLKGVNPPSPEAPHTSGWFRLSSRTFPGVDDLALTANLNALVPESVPEPTRSFLTRSVAWLAVAEVAVAIDRSRQRLPLPAAENFSVAVPGHPTMVSQPALTPQPGVHLTRVRQALELLETSLSLRLANLIAEAGPLLPAVRRCFDPLDLREDDGEV